MSETITLEVTPIAERLPDGDTDVILFDDDQSREGFLGAYVGHELDGRPSFVDAGGFPVTGVTHWCEVPRRG